MRSHAQNAQHQHIGSSLFEVLVSVLILSVGILGVAAVQTRALRNTLYALELTQAASLGQAMLETMRSRRAEALAGYYHTSGFACDAQAGGDIGRWIDDLQHALGDSACGEIVCQAGGWCKVSIRWDAVPTHTGADDPHHITTGAQL